MELRNRFTNGDADLAIFCIAVIAGNHGNGWEDTKTKGEKWKSSTLQKKKTKTKTALVTIGLENEKNFENTQDSKGEYLS